LGLGIGRIRDDEEEARVEDCRNEESEEDES
jgi:hypothetical protein